MDVQFVLGGQSQRLDGALEAELDGFAADRRLRAAKPESELANGYAFRPEFPQGVNVIVAPGSG